jgi:predicted MPP superfamily phosphohydrolase
MRFAIFITVVLSIWTLMHAYVLLRVLPLPGLSALNNRRLVLGLAAFFWASYPLSRICAHWKPSGFLATSLEWVGAYWIGILFLTLVCLLASDLLTGFGLLFKPLIPSIRWSALGLAGLLSIVAIVQASRGPVIDTYRITLDDLPAACNGLVAVQISDLHVGDILGEKWLSGIVRKVQKLAPDIIFVTGDLVDGDVGPVQPLVPVLKQLKAPLGVWAVTGNHEFYAGRQRSVALLEKAGFHVLADRWAVAAPGLVVAGVDDLTARRQLGINDDALAKVLGSRPKGATILLCHSPLQVKHAAALGVDLMLSGHTHDGQIWPFQYLVGLFYPYVAGFYRVGAMDLIVSRGTGTWGPPMRLFRREEIIRFILSTG